MLNKRVCAWSPDLQSIYRSCDIFSQESTSISPPTMYSKTYQSYIFDFIDEKAITCWQHSEDSTRCRLLLVSLHIITFNREWLTQRFWSIKPHTSCINVQFKSTSWRTSLCFHRYISFSLYFPFFIFAHPFSCLLIGASYFVIFVFIWFYFQSWNRSGLAGWTTINRLKSHVCCMIACIGWWCGHLA